MKSNLLKRTITGILFVTAIVGLPLWGEGAFRILFLVIALGSVQEFSRLVNNAGLASISPFSNIFGVCLLWCIFNQLSYGASPILFVAAYILLLLGISVAELYRKQPSPINNIAYNLFAQAYVGLPFSLLNLLAIRTDAMGVTSYSALLPLAMFAFIWANDTGAYCVGSLLGKHKLFPRISPKKSWEGFVGGVVIAVLAGYAFSLFFSYVMGAAWWMLMAFVVAIAGTFGDLMESMLKRTCGVKDSGNILPGHGGLLDRFDSTLFAVPAVVVFFYLLEVF